MTTHPRNAVLIALLGSVCVFGAETAQAQKPLIRFNSIASTSAQTRIPKVKPVARMTSRSRRGFGMTGPTSPADCRRPISST
jgi:hypothetical protein